MPELHEDFKRISDKLNESLDILKNNHIDIAEQEKLIVWVKETLDEIKISLQA